jgi:YidC/Oxa1 family membrane protein insertase
MERRVVIFLVLSLAVILGYDLLLKQLGLLPPQDAVQESPTEVTGTRSEDSDTAHPKPAEQASGARTPARPDAPSASSSAQVQPLEQTVTMETDLVRVGLDARGGVISSWELKRHHTAPPEDKPVQLVHQAESSKDLYPSPRPIRPSIKFFARGSMRSKLILRVSIMPTQSATRRCDFRTVPLDSRCSSA